jgi:nitrogen fixation NifU-like protein
VTQTTNNHDLLAMYRSVVLDHARKPRNFRKLDGATHSAEGINPLCGDKLKLYLRVSAENRVVDAAFEGSGCAIAMASASLLTETISNLSVSDAELAYDTVTLRLTQPAQEGTQLPALQNPALEALDGVREHPARVKCATLAWRALHAALSQSQTTATTE